MSWTYNDLPLTHRETEIPRQREAWHRERSGPPMEEFYRDFYKNNPGVEAEDKAWGRVCTASWMEMTD